MKLGGEYIMNGVLTFGADEYIFMLRLAIGACLAAILCIFILYIIIKSLFRCVFSRKKLKENVKEDAKEGEKICPQCAQYINKDSEIFEHCRR